MRLRDRRAAGGVAVLAVVLVAAFAAVNLMGQPGATPSPTAAPSATPEQGAAATSTASASPIPATPSATASPSASAPSGYADLDGMPAPPDLAHRLPLAVMIDDNKHARPQSGMNAASIVYQAPADGGEVRYMLIFQEGDAPDVGPVRSARPYFVRWAAEYRALLGHYGGDVKSTWFVIPSLVRSRSIFDMDALAGGSCPYHRISGRVAPYNAYSNTAALRRCAGNKGYPATIAAGLQPRAFGDDLPLPQRPASGKITVPYPHQTVAYSYDPVANAYLRSVDGQAQIDAADGSRVTARNVVVLYQSLSIDPESEPGYHRPVVGQVGVGDAIVFRDGRAIVAAWRKWSDAGVTRLFDASGREIPLARGRIFIQVVAKGTKVTYTTS